MSEQRKNAILGTLLVILGGLFLVETMGFIPQLPQLFWGVSFGIACVFFVFIYLANGREQWGWLFPIFITAGLTLTIMLSYTSLNEAWVGASFMAFVSAPFWIIFLLNRQEHWWALIPGWVTAVITFIIFISDQWSGEIIGALVMWSVALPFIVVYWRNRAYWWALIPAFIMTTMGFVVLLANRGADAMIGPFMLLMIALPFWAVYFFTKGQWWAVIPAGIFTTLALIVPFAVSSADDPTSGRLIAMAIFLGFALPFAWLWWRQDVYPTNWTKYPAVGFLVVAFAALTLDDVVKNSWPIILIVIGAWLLYDSLHQPKLKS